MIQKGSKAMGRFSVEFEIANNVDMVRAEEGDIPATKIRRMTISGVVDPGATRLVLPESVVKQLGLRVRKGKVKVSYADGRRMTRAEADQIRISMQGRSGLFTAIVEPKRETALIGAIVLEDLDFLVDCGRQKLVPRDPNFVLNEIE